MTPYAFCWFTFGPDSKILIESVRSVHTLYPEAPLYIFADANYPFTHKRVSHILRMMGASIFVTAWPRNGNLRGIAAHQGIVDSLEWAVDHSKADIIVKVDSDVLYLKKGWLEEFAASGKVIGGLEAPGGFGVCGPTYAMRKENLEKIQSVNKRLLASPYKTEEDYEMCNRTIIANPDNSDCFLQVPYSFAGIGPWRNKARAGVLLWDQNYPEMWKSMLDSWEICVVATRPPGEFTGNPEDSMGKYHHLLKLTAKRARAMRNLRRMAHGGPASRCGSAAAETLGTSVNYDFRGEPVKWGCDRMAECAEAESQIIEDLVPESQIIEDLVPESQIIEDLVLAPPCSVPAVLEATAEEPLTGLEKYQESCECQGMDSSIDAEESRRFTNVIAEFLTSESLSIYTDAAGNRFGQLAQDSDVHFARIDGGLYWSGTTQELFRAEPNGDATVICTSLDSDENMSKESAYVVFIWRKLKEAYGAKIAASQESRD